MSTFVDRFGRFKDFCLGGAVAVREANDRADLDGGVFENFPGLLDRVRFDTRRCDVVLGRYREAIRDAGIGHRRVEQGVVDHFCKERERDFGRQHFGRRTHCGLDRGWVLLFDQ